jgi:ParB family chromosome partitioning protein
MSGVQYDRAKYVAENASPEVIEQLDKGEETVYSAYKELKAQKKATTTLSPDDSEDVEDDIPDEEAESAPAPQPEAPPKTHKPKRAYDMSEEELMQHMSARDREVLRKKKEFDALSPEGKIADLECQLFDMRVRAQEAEGELQKLKLEYGIKVDHKDSIIISMKRQIAELKEALEAAEKRLSELER